MIFRAIEDEDLHPVRPDRRLSVFPLDLLQRFSGEAMLLEGASFWELRDAMQHPRVTTKDVIQRWPQWIGTHTVLDMAERGRVAFGIFHESGDIRLASGRRVEKDPLDRPECDRVVRVTGAELFASMVASGLKPRWPVGTNVPALLELANARRAECVAESGNRWLGWAAARDVMAAAKERARVLSPQAAE